MTVTIMQNSSEPEKVGKTLTTITTLTGNLKAETSIIDPIILISGATSPAALMTANYMHIPDFMRYYFIRNIRSIRTGLWEITAHVDVLETFKESIKAQSAVIQRQENSYNLYLDDGIFKVYQNPTIVTKKFPSGFTEQAFILAVAGS